MDWIMYLLLGIVAGFIAGLLGIGGGIVVVPGLIAVFKTQHLFTPEHRMHAASATSLAAMIFTAFSSACSYQRRNCLVWPIVKRVVPGLCLGLLLGAWLTSFLTNDFLQQLFALFLCCMAFSLVFDQQRALPSVSPSSYWVSVAGIFVGLLTTLFGVGGGVLLVPLFLALSLTMHQASGTSSLCGVVVATIGSVLLSRYVYWPAALTIGLGSVFCAPLGARLAFMLPIKVLKRCFAVILLFSAWNLVY